MEELVKKAQNGDENAFTNLVLLFENDLYKIAKSRLQDDDDVCDAVQETMIIAFKHIKTLKKPISFKKWIIKILVNQSNNIYRNKSRKKLISFEEIENEEIIDCSEIENREQLLDFNFFCKNLKYEDRIIMILYYMEKFTDKEISEIMGLNENTIRTKRFRVLQKIKDNIKGGKKLYE